MKIQTSHGNMDALAWHVGRHVAINLPISIQGNFSNGNDLHFRLNGEQVATVYDGLQKQVKTFVEVMTDPYINMELDTTIEGGGCNITINDRETISLSREAWVELFAVIRVAYSQSTKGLDEMRDEEERRRYGLPPRE